MKDFHQWLADMAGTIDDASTISSKEPKAEPLSEACGQEDIVHYNLDTYISFVNPWKPIIKGD